jgi:hypothetical protein
MKYISFEHVSSPYLITAFPPRENRSSTSNVKQFVTLLRELALIFTMQIELQVIESGHKKKKRFLVVKCKEGL